MSNHFNNINYNFSIIQNISYTVTSSKVIPILTYWRLLAPSVFWHSEKRDQPPWEQQISRRRGTRKCKVTCVFYNWMFSYCKEHNHKEMSTETTVENVEEWTWCLTFTETTRLIRDGEKEGWGELWRWGERDIIYVSLHCPRQNDSCIKMGRDESHFNVALIMRDKVTR